MWGLFIALLLTLGILYRIPSGYYMFTPAGAHPVAPLVRVEDAKTAKGSGSIYFVDVYEREPSELEYLFPWFDSHASFAPISDYVPPGSTSQDIERQALQQMASSKTIAAAVAERQLGYHVVIKPKGALVDLVNPRYNALRVVQPGDVIEAVDGSPTPTPDELQARVRALKPGAVATLKLVRGSKTRTVRVKTVSSGGETVIGVYADPEPSVHIVVPVKVNIDSGNIGGPSAGLAFALEVMQKLGRNVTHGYKVAATGQMNPDGTVSAIGGVEQKTWGVREAGADVFLVPVDRGNAREAEKFAGPLKIIPVTSLKQALHALATLPPKK